MAKSTKSAIGDTGWHKSVADRPITMTPLTIPDQELPADDDAMDLDAPPRLPLHVLLPERAHQSADTLRPPVEKMALERLRRDRALAPEEPLLQYMTAQLLPAAAARTLGVAIMGPSGLPSGGANGAGAGAPAAAAPSILPTPGEQPAPAAAAAPKRRGKKGANTNKTAALLGTFGGDGAQDVLVFGRPIPMEVRITMLSDQLQQGSALTAAAITDSGAGGGGEGGSTKRSGGGGSSSSSSSTAVMRLSTPQTGHVGGYNRWTVNPTRAEFDGLFERYFAADKFPATVGSMPARGMDPATFGPVRALVERHQAFTSRRELMEDGTGSVPLRVDLPALNKEYFTPFRMPVPADDVKRGIVRLCREGNHCIVNREGGAEKGYIMREFLLPSEMALGLTLRLEKPQPGHCIDCLLVAWTVACARNVQEKRPVQRMMNTFTVLVRAGEYGAHHLLKRNSEGLSTGIEGFVPAYSRTRREFVPIPREYAMQTGLGGSTTLSYYYAEMDVDFRLTSDTPMSR